MNDRIPLNQRTHKSPSRTIRSFCIFCVGGHRKDVTTCDGDGKMPGFMSCPFHPFRLGNGRPSVKIMRKFCLECMGGGMSAVKECSTDDCLIHPFRFGKNPARAGKGKSAVQMASLRSKKQAVSKETPVYFERIADRQR
jgi:hypothetical protein